MKKYSTSIRLIFNDRNGIECISWLISGVQNSHGIPVPSIGVNRLFVATDVRIDFSTSSIRAYPRINAISHASLFEMPGDSSCMLSSCCFVPASRCDGVGVSQQAHAARSRGFRRGSTWRGHWVAGITLARWLQLVVAGPRDLRGPSFSLFYVSSYHLPSLDTLFRVVPHTRVYGHYKSVFPRFT